MSTRAQLAASYATVLTLMVGWWLVLEGAASVGWGLLILVAYGVLLIGWGLAVSTAGRSHERSEV